MALQALGGSQDASEAPAQGVRGPRLPPRVPGAPAARPPYPWWRKKKGRASVLAVHVEDPLGTMAAAGVSVSNRAPYRVGTGGKLERVAGVQGVGRVERRRV